MFKIAYCAGHGGNGSTPGKRTPDGEYEWDFNNKVALAFEDEIKKYEGVQLLRTDDKTGKTDVPLKIRTDKANAWGADIYISFHHNANTGKWGNWTGVETYVYKSKPANAVRLAEAVHPAVVAGYGLLNRGIKYADFHILRETKMPAILIEGGFMDSTIDIQKLRDDNVLKNVGKAVAQAVAEYAGLKKKAQPKQEQLKPSNNVYVVQKGDTLWGISRKFGMSVDELKKLNGLKSDIIYVGQKLKVKKATKTESKPATKPETDFKVGQKVKVKSSAQKYATGQTIPSWVKGRTYTVQQIKSDRVLLKEIVSWIYKKDVE